MKEYEQIKSNREMNYFLLNTTWNDLYIYISYIVGFMTAFSTVFVAVKTVKTSIYKPIYDKFILQKKTNNLLLIALTEKVEKLSEHNDKILKEVQVNGGSSLKNEIQQIKKSVNYTAAKIRHSDENSSKMLFEMDGDGNLLKANRTMCELFDCNESELMQRNWIIRIAPNEQERVLKEWKQAIENKCIFDSYQTIISGFYSQDTNLTKRNLIKIHIYATPYINAAKELIGFFGWIVKIKDEN